MGHGIAQVFARRRASRSRVYDAHPAGAATRCTRASPRICDDLGIEAGGDVSACHAAIADLAEAVADADIVIEAAPEKLELKQRDLRRAGAAGAARRRCSPPTPPSSRSARSPSGLPTRERMLGTHWWNPPFLVPLVEVVGTADDRRRSRSPR